MVRLTWLMVVAAAVLVSLGCKGGRSIGTVQVSGVVTLDGQAVEGAKVVFTPASPEAKPAAGGTDAAGRFKLTTLDPNDGAMPGNYMVGISKTEGESIGASAIKPGMSYDEQMKASMTERDRAGVKTTPKFKEALPAIYKNPGTSGFKAEVTKEGKNEFTFEMKSK